MRCIYCVSVSSPAGIQSDESCVKELLPPAETCAISTGLNCPVSAQVGMRPSPGHLLQEANTSQQSQCSGCVFNRFLFPASSFYPAHI